MNPILLSVQGLPAFLLYFAGAIAVTYLFTALYTRITPHKELPLIRAGNGAAAVAFAGSLLGFVIPLSSAISNSTYALDALVWAVVALLVQLGAFALVRVLDREVSDKITEGVLAAGVKLATISLAAGLLQAACMTY